VALFGFVVSVVGAWALHEIVELPAQRRLRSRHRSEAAATDR
jgi:peptidoglycan/LPS O-acetylase OafA/YrhL